MCVLQYLQKMKFSLAIKTWNSDDLVSVIQLYTVILFTNGKLTIIMGLKPHHAHKQVVSRYTVTVQFAEVPTPPLSRSFREDRRTNRPLGMFSGHRRLLGDREVENQGGEGKGMEHSTLQQHFISLETNERGFLLIKFVYGPSSEDPKVVHNTAEKYKTRTQSTK